MAKSIEQLQKELEAIQQKALSAKTKLREAEKAERQKAKIQERKDDTRRKILLGGFLQARLKQHDAISSKLYAEFLTSLTRDVDRELFDLPSLEETEA